MKIKKCLFGLFFFLLGISSIYAEEGDKLGKKDKFSFNPTLWMAQLSQVVDTEKVKLNKMLLPGSHDTGTWGINEDSLEARDGNEEKFQEYIDKCNDIADKMLEVDKYVGRITDHALKKLAGWLKKQPYKIIAGWAHTQNYGLREQLKLGVRYFDLRVEHTENDEYVFCHGLRNEEETADYALYYLAGFMNNEKSILNKEIIILDFNHLYENDTDMTLEKANLLAEKVLSYFKYNDTGESMVMVYGNSDLTLADFYNNNKQVLIFFPNKDIYSDIFSKYDTITRGTPGNILSPWPNKQDIDSLGVVLADLLETTGDLGPKQFFVLQCILTEDNDMVEDGLYHLLWHYLPYSVLDAIKDAGKIFSKAKHFYEDLHDNRYAPESNIQMEGGHERRYLQVVHY